MTSTKVDEGMPDTHPLTGKPWARATSYTLEGRVLEIHDRTRIDVERLEMVERLEIDGRQKLKLYHRQHYAQIVDDPEGSLHEFVLKNLGSQYVGN